MRPLRFGIVGCDMISATHGRAFKQLEEEGIAQIVAAADKDKSLAEKFSANFGGIPFGSFYDLLAQREVDTVTICPLSGLHGRMAVQAAKAGKHVLSEKQLDVWIDAVDAAIEATETAGVVYGGIFSVVSHARKYYRPEGGAGAIRPAAAVL